DDSSTSDVNEVKSMRQVSAGGASAIEIELRSNREFLPQRELLVLRIGDREFGVSRYPQTGETTGVTFTLTPEQFAQLQDGDSLRVQYGSGADRPGWNFGKLNKGQL